MAWRDDAHEEENPRLKRLAPWLLGGILLLALALRLYGIDWDRGFPWTPHPDERAILMYVGDRISLPWPPDLSQLLDARISPLNPHWFPYGHLPLYLLKLVAHFASFFRPGLSGDELWLAGRALSVLFDLGTVLLTYLLGRRLLGQGVGLLGAALVAVAVLPIQLAHFYAVDVPLAFFTTLTLLLCARLSQEGGRRWALLAGAALGLALATKAAAATLLLPLALAHLLAARQGEDPPLPPALRGLIISGLAAFAAFFVAMPYGILDFPSFLGGVLEQGAMARGLLDYPYTRQYLGNTPYLYPMTQLTLWGLGLPLGLAAWAGALYFMARAWRQRRESHLLLLSWALPYFLFIGSFQVQFLRYWLPLVPVLALMAAALLLALWRRARGWDRLGAGALIALVLAASLGYALAYVNMYSQEHPAVRAARWLREHAPPGSLALKEHWEESLPNLGRFRVEELPLYDSESQAKLDLMAGSLARADYLVFYSNRLYGAIPRLSQRYPITTRYYRLLFSGELGYELAHYEAAYPQLLGLTLRDDTFRRPGLTPPGDLSRLVGINLGYADESFTVYDHPLVLIFQNTERRDADSLRSLLGRGQPPSPVLLPPADAAAQRDGGTWAELYPTDAIPQKAPLLAWLLALEGMALLAWPVGFWLFRPFRDRGFLLVKALALLLLAYPLWLLASWKALPFQRETILLVLGAAALLSLYLWARGWREIWAFLRANARLLLVSEALFLGAFLLFYAIRLWNPDLWYGFYRGGEKPMDFAYLNAVLKSTYMPPYDPWFAGGYLNYYYFGQFLLAVPIKLLGINPAVAYNLALPTLFALTAGGAFCLVFNLASRAQERKEDSPSPGRGWGGPALAGLVAAALVAVAGNLDGLVQLAQGAWSVLQGGSFPTFDYWRSSRMIEGGFEITEFPFFAFLWGDLHAHLIALPFGLLALGLALSHVLHRAPASDQAPPAAPTSRGSWGALAALGLTLGALRAANTWDLPTYLLAAAGAALLGGYLAGERGPTLWLGSLGRTALALGLALVLFWPFQESYQAFYFGLELAEEKTPFHRYFAVHGLFIFLLLSLALTELLRPRWALLGPWGALRQGVRSALGAPIAGLGLWAERAYWLGAPLAAAALLALRWNTVAFLWLFLALLLPAAAAELRLRRQPSLLFAYGLAALAALLGLGVELVTLQGDLGRMNTVFKFYFQAWALWATAAAFALWWLARQSPWPGSFPGGNHWGRAWWAILLFLGLAVAIYPLAAPPARVAHRFQPLPATADGMAFMAQAVYQDERGAVDLSWDYQAIRWLQDHVQGSPVVVDANTGLYRWGSRVSVFTGLPTIVGWDWHQQQQRWGYRQAVDDRLRDLDELYRGQDPERKQAILAQYQVGYVYVGRLERLYYPAAGLEALEALDALALAYENPEVRIYRVASPGRR